MCLTKPGGAATRRLGLKGTSTSKVGSHLPANEELL